MSGAMVECAVCGSRKWKSLEESHSDELRMSGAARLACENCARETFWLYSQNARGTVAPRRVAAPPPRADATGSLADAPSAAHDSGGAQPEPIRVMQNERRNGLDRRNRPRRIQRRVALQVPVRVRVSSVASPFEEVTRTTNVCRNGIYIQSERLYSKGQPVYVAMNYSPREPGMISEQKATVVRVDPLAGVAARGVAIHLH